jgi:hypothetical protein
MRSCAPSGFGLFCEVTLAAAVVAIVCERIPWADLGGTNDRCGIGEGNSYHLVLLRLEFCEASGLSVRTETPASQFI